MTMSTASHTRHDAAVRDTAEAVRVLVVEDHLLVATGVAMALDDAGFRADACGIGSPEAVLSRVRTFEPQLVLLDLVFEGSAENALALIRPIRALGADVAAFTGTTDAVLLGSALEAGAVGIIHKRDSIEHLIRDVKRLAQQERVLSLRDRQGYLEQMRRDRAERRDSLAPFAVLSRREAAVLHLMMNGLPAEALAADSFVSLSTVRAQIRSVLTKLGVNSQLAAVAMAYQAGWFPSPTPPEKPASRNHALKKKS